MPVPLIFVAGTPRSGTTMLARMLGAHPAILGGPEPHLLTPLAYLGVWDKVDKAPYDHVLAAEAQRLFVSQLPRGEQDYWAACRAYGDALYGARLAGSGKSICLDKTPAYSLILPFIAKVFPDARYLILTRHPAAIFCSYANSFFNGDFAAAQAYNPVLNRYVPALAAFLRQEAVPPLHVRYEDLVANPEARFADICEYIGVPYDARAIDYGAAATEGGGGLGDPLGVQRHSRPSVDSLHAWAGELAADAGKRSLVASIVAALDPADLETLGYPLETLWAPMEHAGVATPARKRGGFSRYHLQRKLIVSLRDQARKRPLFRKALQTARLACDVLLRE